jgi:glucose-1-phosphate cytidylyltransferase
VLLRDFHDIPVVILAGGLGTRIATDGENRPKPMLDIGDRPIIWHIMKYYSSFGAREFILCLGHRGNIIRDYFLNYHTRNVSLSLDIADAKVKLHDSNESEDWKITLVDTGRESLTGERLKKVEKFVNNRIFAMTYGDGLGDVNLASLLKFHGTHNGLATLTAVHPTSRFGLVTADDDGKVLDFSEKPVTQDWINGGFFILEPQIFSYIQGNEAWESGPLSRIATQGSLYAFRHTGFWKPIDTQRELAEMNAIWISGKAPWKNWQ